MCANEAVSENKKVILFISSLGGGGAQRQITELACLLRDRYDVEVLIYHKNFEFRDILVRHSIPVYFIEKKTKVDIVFLVKLFFYFFKNRTAIVLSYLFVPNLYARFVGKVAMVKGVITSERNVELKNSAVRRWIEKSSFFLSDLIIVNSSEIKDIYVEKLKVSPSKIEVINNVVDLDTFRRVDVSLKDIDEMHYLDLAEGQKIICVPARIQRQKNLECLVRAFAKLSAEEQQDKVILFAGNIFDEDYKAELDSVIDGYGLNRRIHFLGPVKDISALYNISDVVVLPSLYEGFSNAVLEAMACCAVVIASNIASNGQIIADGDEGYLFVSDDENDLVSKLRQGIAMSEDSKAAMGARARKKIERVCGRENFLRKYIRSIEVVIGVG